MPKTTFAAQSREIAIKSDAVNVEKRTVEFVFATETPCLCYDREYGEHYEILDCSPGAGDLSRLNNGGPLLVQHDERRQIGVHDLAEFIIDPTLGRIGRAVARFSERAEAEEEFRDIQQGIRRNFSVRYQPLELVLEKTGADGDVVRVTRWQALENSVVSMPADVNCQTRATDNEPRAAVVFSNPHNLIPMNRKLRSFFHNKPDDAPAGGTATAPAITKEMQERAIKDAKAETLRKLNDFKKIAKDAEKRTGVNFDDIAERMFSEDKTTEDLFRAIVESDRYGSKDEHVATTGLIETETRAKPTDQQRKLWLPGDAFVSSDAYKRGMKEKGRNVKIVVEMPFLDPRTRATVTTSGLTSEMMLPGVTMLPVRRATVKDLIPGGVTNLTTIRFVKETSFTNAADMVAEGAQKPEASFAFEEDTEAVKKIAVFVKVTDEMVADHPTIASLINMRLPQMVELKEEDQMLNGDGTGNNLMGILQTTGVLTQAKGTDTVVDAIHKAITKIKTNGPVGGGYEPDAIVIHPNDWQDIRLSKDTNGQYYAGGPFTAAYGNGPLIQFESLWGRRVVVTPAMTEGTALVGAFSIASQWFQKQGLVIESTNSNEDDFEKNLITIRSESRVVLITTAPPAYCMVTGI